MEQQLLDILRHDAWQQPAAAAALASSLAAQPGGVLELAQRLAASPAGPRAVIAALSALDDSAPALAAAQDAAIVDIARSCLASVAAGDRPAAEALAQTLQAVSIGPLGRRLARIASSAAGAAKQETVEGAAISLIGLAVAHHHAKAPHVLTRLHVDALKTAVSLGARGYALALPLISIPNYSVASSSSGGYVSGGGRGGRPAAMAASGGDDASVATDASLHVTASDVSVYHFCAGTCLLGLGRWAEAADMLATCLGVPVSGASVSAVQVEAYKRWILAHLLDVPPETAEVTSGAASATLSDVSEWKPASGGSGSAAAISSGGSGGGSDVSMKGVPPLPRWVGALTSRALAHNAGPYVALAKAFTAFVTSAVLPKAPIGGSAQQQQQQQQSSLSSSSSAGVSEGMVAASAAPDGGSSSSSSSSSSSLAAGSALFSVLNDHGGTWAADGTLPLISLVLPAAQAQRVARLSRVYASAPLSQVAKTAIVGSPADAGTAQVLADMISSGRISARLSNDDFLHFNSVSPPSSSSSPSVAISNTETASPALAAVTTSLEEALALVARLQATGDALSLTRPALKRLAKDLAGSGAGKGGDFFKGRRGGPGLGALAGFDDYATHAAFGAGFGVGGIGTDFGDDAYDDYGAAGGGGAGGGGIGYGPRAAELYGGDGGASSSFPRGMVSGGSGFGGRPMRPGAGAAAVGRSASGGSSGGSSSHAYLASFERGLQRAFGGGGGGVDSDAMAAALAASAQEALEQDDADMQRALQLSAVGALAGGAGGGGTGEYRDEEDESKQLDEEEAM